MSDGRQAIREFAASIPQEFQRHHNLPPHQKAAARASYGAFILGLCGYAAAVFGPYASDFPPPVLLVFAGIAGFGLLLLVVGVRKARWPRDVMQAFWAVALPVAGWWALSAWQGPQVFTNIWVQWFGTGFLAVALVHLFLALRGMPGDARKMVDSDIAANTLDWEDK